MRTTWHPSLLSEGDLEEMAQTLEASGCTEWVIQHFRPLGCADAELCRAAPAEPPSLGARHPRLRLATR